MLQHSTLQFLKDLKINNQKEWFDANRNRYENAKQDIASLTTSIIKSHGTQDADIISLLAKDCTFRINRDIRFSKDKTPYKTNFGISLSKGGKKSGFAGYYIHIEPGGNSFAGGGLWMPEAETLKNIRQEIDYHWDEFSGIIQEKNFIAQYGDLEKSKELSLTREPKGYDKDNPAIEYLKLKSFIASRSFRDEELTDKDFQKKVLNAFQALQPLIKFLNRAWEGG